MVSIKKLLYKMVEAIKENRLPEATTTDKGKIIGVKNDGTYGLVEHLPEATTADEGKVLGIKNDGTYGLITNSSSSLHEGFVTIAGVGYNQTATVDVPISTLGITDPDTIVMVSVEVNWGEFRYNNPNSDDVVVGYSIRRDMGTSSYIRFIAKNNRQYEQQVRIRYVYTTIE